MYEGGIERAKKTSILAPVTSAGGERLNKFGNIIGKKANKADAPKKLFFKTVHYGNEKVERVRSY